jgi:hypothetical protein
MVTNDSDRPIEVTMALGKNEDHMAALRFNPSGTKLYGINWNGHVVIVHFPRAVPAEIKLDVRRAPTLTAQASPLQQSSRGFNSITSLSSTFANSNFSLSVRDTPTRGSNHSMSDASTSYTSEGSKEFSTSPPTGLGVSLGVEDSKPPMEDLSQSPSRVFKARRLSSWKWPLKSKNTEPDRDGAIPEIAVRSLHEQPPSPSGAKLHQQSTTLPELTRSETNKFTEQVMSKLND